MLKVFLVEDEAIIREGLRDIIPWQQYGFTLVGDAGDGEQALPMIRREQPDVLITDIRMPFMDGLALSSLVTKEFPNIKIIIISGYDDFEYAQQAIHIGVEQYLLKPVTKAMLIKALNEVSEKIQDEREQENYMEKFRSEVQEYEQFSRRRFLEETVTGQLSVEEIYEEAGRQGIEMEAQSYNILLYSIVTKDLQAPASEDLQEALDNLTEFFQLYPEYLMFRWNPQTYAVLVKARDSRMQELIDRCVDTIRMHVLPIEQEVEWHVAVGEETPRLSGLPACFDKVNRIYSCRHLLNSCPVLTGENTRSLIEGDETEDSVSNADLTRMDPSILRGFLENGQREEIDNFVDEYVGAISDAAASRLFDQYLLLNVRFTAIAYLESLGYEQKEFIDDFPNAQLMGRGISTTELKDYIRTVLSLALELKEKKTKSQSRSMISKALDYIDRNFADDAISLKEVADYVNVSANYFSAVFSQEMEQTFVEYLTQKRMERAKELLRTSKKRTAEISAEVGYRDPHYFSFVFRKTQGCSPRDYRTGTNVRGGANEKGA